MNTRSTVTKLTRAKIKQETSFFLTEVKARDKMLFEDVTYCIYPIHII